MAEANPPDWRELCAAAAQESDPEKLSSLVSRIINAIDQARSPGSTPDALRDEPFEVAVRAPLTKTVSGGN